jgi:hypothetical protein
VKYPGYQEILPELFTWIQDMNWPIANEVLPLLIAAGDDTVPIIKIILLASPADTIWQYNVLTYIVPHLSVSAQEQLLSIVEQLAGRPTHDQRREEVDKAAQEIMMQLDHKS